MQHWTAPLSRHRFGGGAGADQRASPPLFGDVKDLPSELTCVREALLSFDGSRARLGAE